MKRLILSALAVLSMGACATPQPTIYQPATGPQAVGFSDYRIEPGRYRVMFHGGPGAPQAQVTDYALRRAASLALADGYDWFRVTDRAFNAAAPRNASQVSIGLGGGNYGYHGGGGVGVGTTFNVGGDQATLTTTLEVLMGKGPKPSDGDVYDARGILQSVAAPT